MSPFLRRQTLIPLSLALLIGAVATVRYLSRPQAGTEARPATSADQQRAAAGSPFAYPPATDAAGLANAARASGGVAVIPKPDPQAMARAVVADSRQPSDARVRALKTVVDGKSGLDFDAVLWTFQNDASFAPRYLLVKAMGDLGDDRAVPHLLGALKAGADVEARRIAARALGTYIKVEGVSDALHEVAASDGDKFVRQNAVRTLATLPPTNARWHLEELQKTEKDATVKALIENALAGLDVR